LDELKWWRSIAVQLKAGGEGVSMHRARYVIDYSLSFSLGEYNQHAADYNDQANKTSYLYSFSCSKVL